MIDFSDGSCYSSLQNLQQTFVLHADSEGICSCLMDRQNGQIHFVNAEMSRLDNALALSGCFFAVSNFHYEVISP